MSGATDHPNPKPPSVDRLSFLWRRINDHKMVQWSVAYIALAYGVQHAVTLITEAFEWPHAVERVSMLLLALGLPLVITLAWYHGARASRRISGPELTIISILLVMSSLLFYVFVRPSAELGSAAAQQAGVAGARSASASAKGTISLAVLPFVNLSSDKEQEFFSDGMTEEITAALAKVPDLRVVARTSAFEFKGKNVDIRTMGEQLGATHLIEGSVRKAGNRLRITTQLIKADDGTHIWAEDYDRELTDIFAIQEDIARSIIASLRMPLGLKPGENLVNNRAIGSEDYQQYLRAKALFHSRGLKAITDAAVLLEQLVVRDPDYAPAWALMAQAYDFVPNFEPAWLSGDFEKLRPSVASSAPRADAAARRAIQLDPNLADGYASLALALEQRGKFAEAEELYMKAVALDSNNPDVLHLYSRLLLSVGRLKDGLAMRQRLLSLDPFVPVYNSATAWALWLNGRDDEAIALAEPLPSFPRGYTLSRILAAKGRYRDAADIIAAIPIGNFLPGTVEDAVRLLRAAPARVASPQSLPRLGLLEFTYLYVGASGRVLDFYEGGVEVGYAVSLMNAFLWHPSYASVRKTERFKAYVRAAGLVAYWRARGWPDLCKPAGADDFACE